MRLIDQLRSVRHVFAMSPSRTALTLLGIMIGAGSIVMLAGLLHGGEEALVARAQNANEADLIQVKRDEPPPSQLNKTRRVLTHLDADALGESRLLDGAEVTSEQQRDSRAFFHDKKKRVRLVATAPIAVSLYRLELEKGRFLTPEDLASRRKVCVVGYEVWREMLEERPSLDGVSILVSGVQWSVVGVLKNKPPLGGGGNVNELWMWNRKVLVPRTTFDATFDPEHRASRVFVRLHGQSQLADRISAVEKVVKQTLLRRHLGVQNFKVEGEEGSANQVKMVLTIIEVLLLGTGLLSLLVGGINIMNIMLVTVTERTREIGVRRAVGASPGAILMQFLLEASTIALVGGVIGVLGGVGVLGLVTLVLRKALGEWTMYVETWSIVLGLALSVATGISFGLFPAWRAARLDPVEALRYE